jgi:hypothetical protein
MSVAVGTRVPARFTKVEKQASKDDNGQADESRYGGRAVTGVTPMQEGSRWKIITSACADTSSGNRYA